jgi:hypothetical protein
MAIATTHKKQRANNVNPNIFRHFFFWAEVDHKVPIFLDEEGDILL